MPWTPDLSFLPHPPDAVIWLSAAGEEPIAELVAPLLRAALAVRYSQGYPESAFFLHLAALMERQEALPFAVDGVALVYPDHDGKIQVDRAGIERPVVVVGLSEVGLAWRLQRSEHGPATESIDKEPVHAVFLILSGPDRGSDIKLKAAIARGAEEGTFRGSCP